MNVRVSMHVCMCTLLAGAVCLELSGTPSLAARAGPSCEVLGKRKERHKCIGGKRNCDQK